MRQFFKRLLLPIALVAVTQTSIVSAESIRLIGPGGEVQASPQFSSDIVRNRSVNNEPSRVIGPTSNTDTLWSIASRIRPSNQVSVQQTLLAIYRLNPQAFENQNIHSLIPGSTLRIPSLAQVSSVSTQEAVNVMAAHQARLNQQATTVNTPAQAKPPVEPVKAETQPSQVVNSTQNANETVTLKPEAKPETVVVNAPVTGSDSEIQALEEKNHRLRLMLAEVQTEVSGLKQELGDENRIRSEVEKLLAEERMKREESQRLAPSQLDQLLSNNWIVAGLALIPGLFIALLVMMFLGRRSSSNSQQETTQSPVNTLQDAPTAPVIAGEQSLDDLDEELLLDDDLFGSMDDSESLFGEEKETEGDSPSSSDADDSFPGLEDDDLDFDLEGEDGEDLFAAIDDSGDLDTDFSELSSSSSGISVSGEDKALGLEEMERALDQATDFDEDDDDVGFDLSDDGEMSQADIESLLASDGESEELESSTLDQSMLDDLFSQQEDEDDSEDLLNFDSLLDDESSSDETSKSDASSGFASDEELDDLFANIEAQADLELLEANAKDESALLDEQDDDSLFDVDNTALLDELLTEEPEDGDDATDDDIMSELDELLGDSEESDIPEFDESSTDLLDDFIGELNEEPEGYDSFLSDADTDSEDEKDEGLELFDELLDIEKSAESAESSEEEQDFDSKNFIDDLINNAPESDPLLDEEEFDLDSSIEDGFEADDFDFNPEIEGSEQESDGEESIELTESESEPNEAVEDVIANEFGIPQDDDWAFDDEDVTSESPIAADEPKADDEQVEEPTLEAHQEVVAELETEQPAAEADIVEDEVIADPEDILAELDDLELPEYREEDALADSETESDELVAAETDDEVVAEEEPAEEADVVEDEVIADPDDILAEFDDLELPEYTEEDALVDSETEADELVTDETVDEVVAEEEPAEEADVDEDEVSAEAEDILAEFDDLELPEYTEEDALADSEETADEQEEPVAEEVTAEFDDLDLPEYTEDDALAELGASEDESEIQTEKPVAEATEKKEVNLSDIAKQEFDEQALSDWLSDEDQKDTNFDFKKPLDARAVDSAGMDIDAMLEVGGEDWNGFNLTPDQQATIPDDVPEAERDVWQPEIQVKEPEVAEENWGNQDDFEDFDPATSKFMTIDELMAQTEQGDSESLNLDEEELKLDVGLNEFPDVIGDISDFDVDNNAEAAGKLDLAKIYIEMNDDKGAIKLLEEAIVDGSDDIRQQAKHLIDVINGKA